MDILNLQLPDRPVPDRHSLMGYLPAGQRRVWAELEGPGCIRHIFVALNHPLMQPKGGRRAIIRIYFDDQPEPFVEAPVADFFGVMHGLDHYPIDTHWLSAQAWNGYNCYFPMPFAHAARIEFQAGPQGSELYTQVDWHRYPGGAMDEPRRFCAQWRREMPTQRYGENYLVMDADGPGQLLGFAYGVRLIDSTDRWSHGGADNLYIDGEGDCPAYLRGTGGEDTFGTSFGGALHPPETHHYAAMPYYTHEDTGEARVAQRVAGYRFFDHDTIPFAHSLHFRFGSMQNDICSTAYWYQQPPLRPFFRIGKDWSLLAAGKELPRGTWDCPLPDTGAFGLAGPFKEYNDPALVAAMSQPPGPAMPGIEWVRRESFHHFTDLSLSLRPAVGGVGTFHEGWGLARCVMEAPRDTTARFLLAWDDRMVLRVNDAEAVDLGEHRAFRPKTFEAPLRKGRNFITLALSNTPGSNHGGWAFVFRAQTPDGLVLTPQLPLLSSPA